MHIDMSGKPVEALILQAYDRRSQLFSEDLFCDPAWMILLRLRASPTPLDIAGLNIATSIPLALLKRWLAVLADRGHIATVDENRYLVTDAASEKLDQIFADSLSMSPRS